MSSTNPIVTVVIPAYNAARWVAETIDSVLAQTFRDFEVIVVDDGSTDQTPEVAASYGHQIQYLRKENGGSASARNVGIRAARGSYIAFVDADDLWYPDKLQLQMQLFQNYPDLAWVYSDAMVFTGESDQTARRITQCAKLHKGEVLRPLFLHDFICSATPVVKRNVFDTVGYFDETLLRSEDWDLWLRMAEKYEVKFVDRPLAKHRLHQHSKTGSKDFNSAFQCRLRVIKNAVDRNPDKLVDLLQKAEANLCIGMGQIILKHLDSVGARQMFLRSFRLYPLNFRSFGYWMCTFLPAVLLKRFITLRHLLRGHR